MRRRAIFRMLDRYIGIPIAIILSMIFKRKKRLPIEDIHEILIVKLAAIGDTILLIPTLRALKRHFPKSKITFLCSPINETIVKKIPFVDNIVLTEVHEFIKNPLKFFKVISKLRKTYFDLVIDAGQWERINTVIISLLRFHYSVGFKTRKQFKHFIYNDVVEHSRTRHELENFLDLLIPLGIVSGDEEKKLEYFLKEKDFKFAEEFWSKNNLNSHSVICFHPGCGENGKPREWPDEYYINLGIRLVGYDENIRILVTGSPLESERCKTISNGIGKNVINTAGLFPLDNVVALVQRTKLIVCSNTGMLHIAGSVGTKTLGLHGPTNPAKWGSYSRNSVLIQSDKFCSPCLYLGHEYGCQAPQCMAHISVDDVFIHIRKALNPELFTGLEILNN